MAVFKLTRKMPTLFFLLLSLQVSSLSLVSGELGNNLEEDLRKYFDNEQARLLFDTITDLKKKSETNMADLRKQVEASAQRIETLELQLVKQSDYIRSLLGSQNNGNIAVSPDSRGYFPRTCFELMSTDPTLDEGMYLIDPDGWNSGDAPVYAFCAKSGETLIPHDSEDTINVGHCFDPGCYSRRVTYDASLRQLKALVELSPTCDQYVRYDCLGAVFEFNEVEYSWWNDRNGEKRNYWSGSNDTVHTCACGLEESCVEPTVRCNCDSAAPAILYDEGFISNKRHLPVTQLNFGRTSSTYSSGNHTLGKLRCFGNYQAQGKIPASCADLWRAGQTVSGLYQVQASDGTINTVFCDMTKLPEESGHQSYIGVTDVKSFLVHFTAVRTSGFTAMGVIPYSHTLLNIGNAMNVQTGKFTAPLKGIYYFAFNFSGLLNEVGQIHLNGVNQASTETMGQYPGWDGASCQVVLSLQKGDVVYTYQAREGNMIAGGGNEIHFTGSLLQQL